jgi:hypothetical protein
MHLLPFVAEELLVNRDSTNQSLFARAFFVFDKGFRQEQSAVEERGRGGCLPPAALRTIDLPILQSAISTDGYYMYPPRDPNNPARNMH